MAARVIAWQAAHGRHGLPWQGTRDPYRVWLSEVMLQQTQVAVVLGFYARFLARFPDVQALAAAPLDEVLALWSGLGYYSRARNLHRCAQVVVAAHGGRFPPSAAALQQLPGIGRSTAAAIAAFCFGERVAILDGNVRRVLARVTGFDGDLAQPRQVDALWQRAEALLPEGPGIEAYTQGLMDLGAGICLARAPRCLLCPLREACVAAASGEPTRWPVRSRRQARGTRRSVWLWLRHTGRDGVLRHWLQRRPAQGIWAGLWSLPEFDHDAALDAALAAALDAGPQGRLPTPQVLPSFTHTLTHLDWTLEPRVLALPPRTPAAVLQRLTAPWPTGAWLDTAQALAAGLPAPLRRLLDSAADGAADGDAASAAKDAAT